MAKWEKGKIPQGATPFEKGKSGNPKGRPPDVKNLIMEVGGESCPKMIIKKLLDMALKKNDAIALNAIKELLDRLYGKSKQDIEGAIEVKQVPNIIFGQADEPTE